MGLFESFRDPGWNTYHSERPITFQFDVTTAIVTYLSIVLAASLLMVVVGTRGNERWTTFFRLLLSLHTGVIIIVCIVGQHWQTSQVRSHCEYTPEVTDGIIADIGIHVGLKSVNITLRTANGSLTTSRFAGTVNYNEEFSFNHVRDIKDSYILALERGLPRPILYSLEYFNSDEGGFTWHRAMRTAGHLTYILLWTALVVWFIANVLLCFVLSRGLAMLTLSGCLMVTAVIVYHAMQPTMPLVVPFEDATLRPNYGWCFWLCFAAGILASVAGIVLLVLHARYPTATNRIFLISDTLYDDDQHLLYDYSPGPLKIDTPFSRRLNRVVFTGGEKKSTAGLSNEAFLLEDMPSTYRRTSDIVDSNLSGSSGSQRSTPSGNNTRSFSPAYADNCTVTDSSQAAAEDSGRDAGNRSQLVTSVVIEHTQQMADVDDHVGHVKMKYSSLQQSQQQQLQVSSQH
jgi:hypothetical protein